MDTALRHRVNAGRVAVLDQVNFFREQFGSVETRWKPDDTRVTFADFAISERIFAELRRSFSRDDFCSEEFNPADEVQLLESKYGWVLDPIDGTNNYALGLPFCAISLALLKEGVPVYGFVYDYARDALIEGGPGEPLLVGKRKVTLRDDPFTPKAGVVGLHFPVPPDAFETYSPVMRTFRLRSLGSGTLNFAYTALGILDGCLDFKVKVWDIAACVALLAASGREMEYLGPKPFPMKEFHVNGPLIPYFAGSQSFCEYVRGLSA
jgi:myo-inositol-1(or 4)-monophosphatase